MKIRNSLAFLAGTALLLLGGLHATAGQRTTRIQSAEIIGVAKRPGMPKGAAADRVFVEGATISVRRGSLTGPEVTRAKADAKGRFAIPVRPGLYYLVPLAAAGDARAPIGKPLKVVARAGRTAEVTLLYPRR